MINITENKIKHAVLKMTVPDNQGHTKTAHQIKGVRRYDAYGGNDNIHGNIQNRQYRETKITPIHVKNFNISFAIRLYVNPELLSITNWTQTELNMAKENVRGPATGRTNWKPIIPIVINTQNSIQTLQLLEQSQIAVGLKRTGSYLEINISIRDFLPESMMSDVYIYGDIVAFTHGFYMTTEDSSYDISRKADCITEIVDTGMCTAIASYKGDTEASKDERDYPFHFCKNLKKVHLSEFTTKCAPFYGCFNLEELTVSENNSRLKSIRNCIIDTQASWSETSLDEVKTSRTGWELVAGCKKTGVIDNVDPYMIVIPHGVERIANTAFYGKLHTSDVTCKYKLEFPSTITCLGNSSFGHNREKAHEVDSNINSNVKYDYINIPCPNLKVIENYVFSGHTVDAVTINMTPNEWSRVALGNANSNPWVASHENGVDTKVLFKDNQEAVNIVLDNVQKTKYTFAHLDTLDNVTFKKGVPGAYAFWRCQNLKTITWHDDENAIEKTPIGFSAFNSCSSLSNIEVIDSEGNSLQSTLGNTLPSYVNGVGNDAFAGCKQLKQITLTENIKALGRGSFSGCSTITNDGLLADGEEPFDITLPQQDDLFIWGGAFRSTVIKELRLPFTGCTRNITFRKDDNEDFYLCGPSEDQVGWNWIIPKDHGKLYKGFKEAYSEESYADSYPVCLSQTVAVYFTTYDKELTRSGYAQKIIIEPLSDYEIPRKALSEEIYTEEVVFGNNIDEFEDPVLPTRNEKVKLKKVTIPFVGYKPDDGCFLDLFTNVSDYGPYETDGMSIPESLETVIVTGGEIREDAFVFCSTVCNITVPDNITTIGFSAFQACGIAEFVVPNTVTTIESLAFAGCKNLKKITIPDSVENVDETSFSDTFVETATGPTKAIYCLAQDELKDITITSGDTIKGWGFSSCYNLENIVIPNSVTKIEGYAFSGCNKLKSITLPFVGGSVDYGPYRFGYIFNGGADPTTNNQFVPESLETVIITGGNQVGADAFKGCTNLKSITIPNSVTSIGSDAFKDCSSLESITLPFIGATKDGTSDTHLGYIFGASSYSYNEYYVPASLKTVVITGGTSIGSAAFNDCRSLTSIEIPDSVTSIGNYAFWNCTNLTNITIPDSVTSIGSNAFYYCESITSITIPEGVTSIEDSTFSSCESLKSITIPEGVTSMGNHAFFACYSLESITIPDSVTSIGYNAFYGCRSLPSIVIPEAVTSISEGAFHGCESLTSITVPNSVISIGDDAFFGCESLTSIVIPEGVTSIGDEAFKGCSRLTSITIPHGVTSIGDYAFANCTNLKSITIPDSVTSIGSWAFGYCDSLTSIVIPKGVTNIGDHAFYRCAFEWIVFYGIQDIGEGAFWNCSNLKAIVLPNSIKTINQNAFNHCTALEAVYFRGTQAELKNVNISSTGNSNLTNATRVFIGADSTADLVFDNNDDNTCYVKGVRHLTSPDVIIPEYVNGRKVIGIGTSAFRSNKDIVTVSIPQGIQYIEGIAFSYCSNLTHLTFRGNVTNLTIFDDALRQTNIKQLVLPQGTKEVKNTFVGNCTSLTSIVIPDSVTYISENSFYGCSNIDIVSVSNSNTRYHVKGNCLINTAQKKLLLGGNNCVIPDDGSVTSIGYYAFHGRKISYLTIPEGIKNLSPGCFQDCSHLTTLVIPKTVTKIENYAIMGTLNLKTIFYTGTKEQWDEINKNNNTEHLINVNIVYNADIDVLDLSKYSKDLSFTSNDDGSCLVTGIGDCNDTELRIPPISPSGDSVTAIYDGAFLGDTHITSVEFSDSVTEIQGGAFSGCQNLTRVVMGTGIDTIGYGAFYNCNSLEGVYITDIANWCNISFDSTSSSSNPLHYAHNLYLNGELLTELIIPRNVVRIQPFAFRRANCINTIKFEEGSKLLTICDGAFYGVNPQGVELPPSVKEIGQHILQRENDQNGLYLTWAPNRQINELTINSFAFEGAFLHNLTCNKTVLNLYPVQQYASSVIGLTLVDEDLSTVTLQDYPDPFNAYFPSVCYLTIPNATNIGYNVFGGLNSLISITLPFVGATKDGEDNTYFGYIFGAFSSSYQRTYVPSSLKTVVITSGSRIDNSAFYGCENLASITIPECVTSIGKNAFYNCTSLAEVHISDLSAWCSIDFKYYSANPVYYAKNLYLNEELVTDLIIPTGVTSISYAAFSGCTSLTSITIPDSVTSIGARAFYKCTNLTSITISNSVENISEKAFQDCNGLQRVHVDSLNQWLITNFTPSTDPVDSSNPLYYAKRLYVNNELLTCIDTSGMSSLKRIEDLVLANSEYLHDVKISADVMYIGSKSFHNCKNIAEVNIEGNTKLVINSQAFMGCENMRRFTLTSAKSKYGYILEDCVSLEEVTLPFIGRDADFGEDEYYVFCSIFGDRKYSSLESNSVQLADKYYHIEIANDSSCYYRIPKSLKKVTINGGKLFTRSFNAATFEHIILNNVVIPEDSWFIFEDCTALKHVEILGSTSRLSCNMFEGCENIKSIILTKNLTNIDTAAFNNTKIQKVFYQGGYEDWLNINANTGGTDGLRTAHLIPNYSIQ